MIKWPVKQDFWILAPHEIAQLPPNTWLHHINGVNACTGRDDTVIKEHGYVYEYRENHSGWGVMDINNHPLQELFLTFILATESKLCIT